MPPDEEPPPVVIPGVASDLTNTLTKTPAPVPSDLSRFAAAPAASPSPSATDEIDCPRCAERIKAKAKMCRFCNLELAPPTGQVPRTSPSPKASSGRLKGVRSSSSARLRSQRAVPEAPTPHASRVPVIGVVFAIVCLSAGAFGAFLRHQGSPEQPPERTAESNEGGRRSDEESSRGNRPPVVVESQDARAPEPTIRKPVRQDATGVTGPRQRALETALRAAADAEAAGDTERALAELANARRLGADASQLEPARARLTARLKDEQVLREGVDEVGKLLANDDYANAMAVARSLEPAAARIGQSSMVSDLEAKAEAAQREHEALGRADEAADTGAPTTRRHFKGAIGKSIDLGLAWLARHQGADGSWDPSTFGGRCGGANCRGMGLQDFKTGISALALIAFLRDGVGSADDTSYVDSFSNFKVSYAQVVRNGVGWLQKQQSEGGRIGPAVGELMYNHAIATLALAEACASSKDESLRAATQKAVDFLLAARNAGLGWRYLPGSGNSDTSVTGWCFAALDRAKQVGFQVPADAFGGALAWLDRVTDKDGQIGYDRLGSGEIYVPGKNEGWAHHPTMSAIGMLCRLRAGRPKNDPTLQKEAALLLKDLPNWSSAAQRPPVDFYYWHHGTLALRAFDGASGPAWKAWEKALLETLRSKQNTSSSCSLGSWDTDGIERWAYAGGRVYGTALNVVTLEAIATPSEERGMAGAANVPQKTASSSLAERELLSRVKAWMTARRNLKCYTCEARTQLKCTTCGGSGTVKTTEQVGSHMEGHVDVPDYATRSVACSKCQGRGFVPCKSCVNGFSEYHMKELERVYGGSAQAIVERADKPESVQLSEDGTSATVRWSVRYYQLGVQLNPPAPNMVDETSEWRLVDRAWRLQ